MSPSPKKCPLCRQPRSAAHSPFCSKACKDRDLLRWLDDGYALPGPPAPDADFGDDIDDGDEGKA